jgi:hypothetical protein
MKKEYVLRALSLIGKATAVAGFLGNWVSAETAAIIFASASAVKEVALIAGDYLDDGKKNDSFK